MHVRQVIRTAQSCATESQVAAQEFQAGVTQPDMGLVIFFCSSNYDLDALAAEMSRRFAGVPVLGCTTAGEIGPAGYRDRSLTGASFAASACSAVIGHFDGLQQFGVAEGQAFAQALLQRFETQAPQAGSLDSFAFLLIDGLSAREDLVTSVWQRALGDIPLVGGSAGDGLNFERTHVYYDGAFHTDSAALVLVQTALPFRIFKTQHFIAGDERMVVTEADTVHRRVAEINGLPAAGEYARLVGVGADNLDPMRFASSPVVVLIDGKEYVRSIQKVNADGSLSFYCAIEEGLVLRVASGVNLVENLERTLERLHAELGPLQLLLGCDCVLSNLELTQRGLVHRVEEIFQHNHVVGFSTYGEQYHGVHVNQTLVGIAFGSLPETPHG